MSNEIVGSMFSELQSLTNHYHRLSGEKQMLEKTIAKTESELKQLHIPELEQCLLVLQKLGGHQREIARKRLEELGTLALQYSLGPDNQLIIQLKEVRKKPIAEVYVYNKTTGFQTDPLEANGGGIVDILSIAMRIVALQCIQNPSVEGPILLDEPFKMVSEEYIPMIVNFTKTISQEFGRQIILVTHNPYLAENCDQILRVALDEKGVSHVGYGGNGIPDRSSQE